MSVRKSQRNQSKVEYLYLATKIRKEIATFVMSDHNVPKRWNFVFTFPQIKRAQTLVLYLYDYETTLNMDMLKQSIVLLNTILSEFQFMLEVLPLNPNKIQPLAEICVKELNLIRPMAGIPNPEED